MEEVSTRLFEREMEDAGNSTTPDLNLGVMVEDTITDAMKARADTAIRIHFFLQINITRSNALFTISIGSAVFFMALNYLLVIR
jgi:hypothetical protein